jgi:hypothetical protein
LITKECIKIFVGIKESGNYGILKTAKSKRKRYALVKIGKSLSRAFFKSARSKSPMSAGFL